MYGVAPSRYLFWPLKNTGGSFTMRTVTRLSNGALFMYYGIVCLAVKKGQKQRPSQKIGRYIIYFSSYVLERARF